MEPYRWTQDAVLRRPAPTSEGFTYAWTIFVPGESLVRRKERIPRNRQIQYLPPIAPGRVAVVQLVLVPARLPRSEWPGRTNLVAFIQRLSVTPDEDAILVYWERAQSESERRLWNLPTEMAEGMPPVPERFSGDTYAIDYGRMSDGRPYFVDLVVRHPEHPLTAQEPSV